jgi:uncharacterized protein (DUF427 family)
MSKSPGHRKWPDHRVEEQHLERKAQVMIDGQIVADSSDVIKVEEDGSPDRYYFPRSDIRMDVFEKTQTTSECPFKGTARYFSVDAGGKRFEDVAWTYEEPYEEHEGLKDRVAFWEEKAHEIEVRID